MKTPNPKLKQSLQKLLDEANTMAGQMVQIENQIDERETMYLEKSWFDGNVLLGWNRNLLTSFPPNSIKVHINPKEKIFGLSSVTSPALAELGVDVDRHLSPFGQQRFQSKKKKKIKKRNVSEMRRPRPIRKKRRK